MKAGDELVFSFGEIERNAIGFRESRDHKDDEGEDLRERHLEDIPTRDEAQIVSGLGFRDTAKAKMIRE